MPVRHCVATVVKSWTAGQFSGQTSAASSKSSGVKPKDSSSLLLGGRSLSARAAAVSFPGGPR